MTPSSALPGTFSPRGEGKINYLNGTAVVSDIVQLDFDRSNRLGFGRPQHMRYFEKINHKILVSRY